MMADGFLKIRRRVNLNSRRRGWGWGIVKFFVVVVLVYLVISELRTPCAGKQLKIEDGRMNIKCMLSYYFSLILGSINA
jgi:hypothetical protein